jgi:uncharacterized delta-60 repeat protein
VALQRDGKIVVAGFRIAANDSDFALARYNTDETLDASFGAGGRVTTDLQAGSFDFGRGVALQRDGRIVVAGWNQDAAGTRVAFALARYNPDGSVDASFGSGGAVTTEIGRFAEALDLAIQPDGRIVAAGFGGPARTIDFVLARYRPDGSLDANFGRSGTVITDFDESGDFGHAVGLEPDGKIVVAGFTDVSLNNDFALARYNPDGTLDPTFGTAGLVTTNFAGGSLDGASALVIQRDGKIVAAGGSDASGSTDFALARYLEAGSCDDPDGDGDNHSRLAPAQNEDGPVSGPVHRLDQRLAIPLVTADGGVVPEVNCSVVRGALGL